MFIGGHVLCHFSVDSRERPAPVTDTAVIGHDHLRLFRVTFDVTHQRVRLDAADRAHTDGPLWSYGFSRTLSRMPGQEGWRVYWVDPTAPAAHDLKVGDLITTVDGQPAPHTM